MLFVQEYYQRKLEACVMIAMAPLIHSGKTTSVLLFLHRDPLPGFTLKPRGSYIRRTDCRRCFLGRDKISARPLVDDSFSLRMRLAMISEADVLAYQLFG